MLLEDEEWRHKTDAEIARHTGVKSGQTVRKYKSEFSARTGFVVSPPLLRCRRMGNAKPSRAVG